MGGIAYSSGRIGEIICEIFFVRLENDPCLPPGKCPALQQGHNLFCRSFYDLWLRHIVVLRVRFLPLLYTIQTVVTSACPVRRARSYRLFERGQQGEETLVLLGHPVRRLRVFPPPGDALQAQEKAVEFGLQPVMLAQGRDTRVPRIERLDAPRTPRQGSVNPAVEDGVTGHGPLEVYDPGDLALLL